MELIIPKDLVFDGRIEKTDKIIAVYSKNGIEDYRVRQEVGGFFRVEKEGIYHTTSVSGIDSCEWAVEQLVRQVAGDWNGEMSRAYPIDDLEATVVEPDLTPLMSLFRNKIESYETIDGYTLYTNVSHSQKWLLHRSGTCHHYKKGYCGIYLQLNWKINGQIQEDLIVISALNLHELMNQVHQLEIQLTRSLDYVTHKIPLEPGRYPVVMSPQSTGMFVHECFGHLREADFGNSPDDLRHDDEAFKMEPITHTDIPCVYDDGRLEGWGYTPVDDEGELARGVLLYQQGTLQNHLIGKMHTQATAKKAGVQPTGNGRAVDFMFEPLARMTNTYLTAGSDTFETLLKQAEGGVYVEQVREGNGQSLFSLSPGRCWRIRGGKIAEPVCVNLITGTIDTAIDSIKGRSHTFELHGMVKGGCGKLDQFPLEVGFGGPHTYLEGLVLR